MNDLNTIFKYRYPNNRFQKPSPDKVDLEKRESELKERALRNKVVRTRKFSGSGPTTGSSQ